MYFEDRTQLRDELMSVLGWVIGVSFGIFLFWCGIIGTSANLAETKANACATFNAVGYECVGYEGYQWGTWVGGSYGGAKVWYTLRVKDVPSTLFTGFVQRWGDEYHVYSVSPVNRNMVITN